MTTVGVDPVYLNALKAAKEELSALIGPTRESLDRIVRLRFAIRSLENTFGLPPSDFAAVDALVDSTHRRWWRKAKAVKK